MSVRSHLALGTADLSAWALRTLLKRRGGSVPGTLALKIDPQIIAELADIVDESVVVTGTNGKTTTTNLIADALEAAGAHVVCNRAGNNMEPGIAGAMIDARKEHVEGRRIGVFECDELYTRLVFPKLKPAYLVLLNLFRDQLDRYGEIDHTQDMIVMALQLSPKTTLIYNADDPLCTAIAGRVENRSIPFGIEGATGTEHDRISDSRFCARCNAPLDYAYVQYGQLGAYRCPACGWSRPALATAAEHVELGCGGYEFDVVERAAGADASAPNRMHITTTYNGLYLVYNVMAALVAARRFGVDAKQFQKALDAYVPEGGRMASWQVGARTVVSNLAKNPVGFDRQIQQIKTADGRLGAFFLNDNDADGHDVSWIWDVEFERLASLPGFLAFAGGTRAHDMQVRLKYAGLSAQIIGTVEEAVAAAEGIYPGEKLYAVANYTAFPPLVQELEALTKKGHGETGGVGGGVAGGEPGGGEPGGVDHGETGGMGGGEPGGGEPGGARGPQTSPAPVVADTAPTPALERPLRLVHLYPDALNLYGDGGNVIALSMRCAWRGIPARVDEVHMGEELHLETADVVLMGGGADRDQLAVAQELLGQRAELCTYIEDGGALLAICGSYQLLGRSYYMGDEKVEGLGALAVETVRGDPRLIGNVAVETALAKKPFVGFENHGGRTHLDASETPLGRSVVAGTGNNGEDGFEGTLHKGTVGTYLHGPALPKNPELADWLLTRALERRAAAGDVQAAAFLPLAHLDDTCEHEAHDAAMKLLR